MKARIKRQNSYPSIQNPTGTIGKGTVKQGLEIVIFGRDMRKKTLVNYFLVFWLLVLAIDAAPNVGGWHKDVKENLDAYLDVTGLWQGGWELFAPNPDKQNVAITANITFLDGKEVVWRSPDWRSLSAVQRFLRFREAEFIDNIQKSENSLAWANFADYLTRTNLHPDHPELKPKKIIMTREWVIIPPPNPINIKQFPEVPDMDSRDIFYSKDYQP